MKRKFDDEEFHSEESNDVQEITAPDTKASGISLVDDDDSSREELIKKGKLNPLGQDEDAKGTDAVFVENKEDVREWSDDVFLEYFHERLSQKGSSHLDAENNVKPEGELKTFRSGFLIRQKLYEELYEHQRVGVKWMYELYKQGGGGIVGDEMGLGKTLMVLSFLEGLHSTLYAKCTQSKSDVLTTRGEMRVGNILIICPLTLISHWVSEAHRFVPFFRVIVLHRALSSSGQDNLELLTQASNCIFVTTYDFVRNKLNDLNRVTYLYTILDEGHKIKNPKSGISIAIKSLRSENRLILSGSPIQNNLAELWSLFDFVYPGKLGTLPVFKQQFIDPIKFGSYTSASYFQFTAALKCAKALKDTIAPFLLRRLKKDVLPTLPNKTENVVFVKLSLKQRELYLEYINSFSVTKVINGDTNLLVAIDYLRKVCNHPLLLNKNVEMDHENVMESAKVKVLLSLLDNWRKEKHKALIFCQTKQMLNILQKVLEYNKYIFLRMDGDVAAGKRSSLIDAFNHDDTINCFILTTRVGGLGINLTGADRVVLFDPDWNPTVDSQAKERTLRIGQIKNVSIYKLICSGTIEERIYNRQISKEIISNKILSDQNEVLRKQFKKQIVKELFQLTDTVPKKESKKQVDSDDQSDKDDEKDEKKNKIDLMGKVVEGDEKVIDEILMEKANTLSDEEKRLTDEETAKIAEEAIYKLKLVKRNQIMGRRKSSSAVVSKESVVSSPQVPKQEKGENVEGLTLAERLANFIEKKGGKVSSDDVLKEFSNDISGINETRVFKSLLKNLCRLDKKRHLWVAK
ncbi:DNA repair and recombination protein RAD26, putative [Entamoeba invadens IP1]|uniref:DNA repair and recombination protein RAD26, putative n=1 Tax=Entamoeba invadens IP1 TaxID=370355 RepID=A0A0A1U0U9_ENTIV|nr:DNA repair and recombination protein RAD26, putative [Entamoeba invadens IP1]ELP84513.1 DNA repair and recombination protein RAD26, putative [Entamoeba invadens IP1]|eukprot:XP_004183859.1 DNA repair and recombination protein RAD26, putative [Entamoeba invadens IP1]